MSYIHLMTNKGDVKHQLIWPIWAS